MFLISFLRPLVPLHGAVPIATTVEEDGGHRRKSQQLQNCHLWTYALTFAGVACFVVIMLNNFQDQLVLHVTPVDALKKYHNLTKMKFRLDGLVLEGSMVHLASSSNMEFVIIDIMVWYQRLLPNLFHEGHSVVVEGFVKPFMEEIKKAPFCNYINNFNKFIQALINFTM